MYDIVKNVIISGDFRLSDMQTKIDTLWVQGDLTEDERNELIAIMKQYVKPESEAPEQIELYKQLLAKYESLDERDQVGKWRCDTGTTYRRRNSCLGALGRHQ